MGGEEHTRDSSLYRHSTPVQLHREREGGREGGREREREREREGEREGGREGERESGNIVSTLYHLIDSQEFTRASNVCPHYSRLIRQGHLQEGMAIINSG